MSSRFAHSGLGSIQNQSGIIRDDFTVFDPTKEYDRSAFITNSDEENGNGGGGGNGGALNQDGNSNGNDSSGDGNDNSKSGGGNGGALSKTGNFNSFQQTISKQAADLGMKEIFNKYKLPIAAGFGGLVLIALLK